MRDARQFRAKFRDLIITALGKPQKVAWEGDVTIFQASSSPERWEAQPMLKQSWKASSCAALARILEESFVERITRWERVQTTTTAEELDQQLKSARQVQNLFEGLFR